MTVSTTLGDSVDPRAPILGQILRHRWTWTGNGIGTGYSTFFGNLGDPVAFTNAISAFLTSTLGTGASGALPNGVNLVPDAFVDTILADTGELQFSTGITPPASFAGGASGTYSAAAGMCVTWNTTGIVNGKRVRGRTFLVPLQGNKLDSDGTLSTTFLTAARTAATTYVGSAAAPLVWHRPVGGTGGQAFSMVAASIRDRTAILTSRR